jgi:hypothetical protein
MAKKNEVRVQVGGINNTVQTTTIGSEGAEFLRQELNAKLAVGKIAESYIPGTIADVLEGRDLLLLQTPEIVELANNAGYTTTAEAIVEEMVVAGFDQHFISTPIMALKYYWVLLPHPII